MNKQVYPFRLDAAGPEIAPESPGECEPQCVYSDELLSRLGYVGYSEYREYMSRTRDERQCRGCGRWGIFERRALTANLPNGRVVR